MTTCRRCGLCCWSHNKKCKYLRYFKTSNKSYCSVFKTRLGRDTGIRDNKGRIIRCTMRINSPVQYEGCPYNKEVSCSLN